MNGTGGTEIRERQGKTGRTGVEIGGTKAVVGKPVQPDKKKGRLFSAPRGK